MRGLIGFILLACTGMAHASVTAAWKLAIEARIPHHESDGRVRKLAKPPGESAFFEAGDEIWDVSTALTWEVDVPAPTDDPFQDPIQVPRRFDWKGDWVVWNARSQMFIARGSWSQILLVGEVLGFKEHPIVLRSRLEVAPRGDSKAGKARTISFVSRSGHKSRAESDGTAAEVEAFASASDNICDVRCRLSWPAEAGDRRWDFHTGVIVREDVRTRLARKGSGRDAWDAWLTVSRELPSGLPFGQVRWIESGGRIERWALLEPGGDRWRKVLGPNRVLGIHPLTEHEFAGLIGVEEVFTLPDVVAPPELEEWVRGSLIDVGDFLRSNGVKIDLAAGDFGGFDPRNGRIVVVADEMGQDLVEAMFSKGRDGLPPQVWIETDPESGGWGLSARSGERAGIARRAGEAPDLLFEIEPTLGPDGHTIDLSYKFDIVPENRAIGRLDSATTLASGKPVKLVTKSQAGTKDLEVVLTGTATGE